MTGRLAPVLVLGLSFLVLGCSSGQDRAPIAHDAPILTKATKETYLSGEQFCQLYSKITSHEYAVRVKVPKSYEQPELGQITIYAYTTKAFDSNKPSYLFIDGGPGQNTHGLIQDYLNGDVNEIRFDQRGLGCSALPTWDEYQNVKLYSTRNNARDVDLVRQAYGIQKWSVYGVSYGTVPATVYASLFEAKTTSLVLEGVVGDTALLGASQYRADRLNLVLEKLNPQQRASFDTLMFERDSEGQFTADSSAVMDQMFDFFYSDKGMSKLVEKLKVFIREDGTISRAAIAELRARKRAQATHFPRPQQPGAVDENMLEIIYCKDLAARHHEVTRVVYRRNGFQVKAYPNVSAADECDQIGESAAEETPYLPKDFKTSAPVYYFQGAYDGATLAKGAIEHWQTVPQAKSYFLLAEKGGHNPNLTRLESRDKSIVAMETKLFGAAVQAQDITQAEVTSGNAVEAPDEQWKLYLSPNEAGTITNDLEGIDFITADHQIVESAFIL